MTRLIVQPLNCTLKRDKGEPSSTDAMIKVLKDEFTSLGVSVADTIHIASHNVLAGVTSDEGEGDDWPAIRAKILAADILVIGTPIWMGQAGSVAKRVLERMDAFLAETDDQGRMPSYSKVAVAAIVGNEDGAHAASSQIFQALNDVGWTIPAVAACYWVGEAMGSVDFKDLKETPEMVGKTAKMVAGNAAHLAGLLKSAPYPG
ncbi:flavodoxin family protein [Novosphingobium sp. P6W]|uniref:flavodoxin family protein n=1 Tax=Novosphingobium sp. P6W TaxID=1609758 RepID=UPI0005C2FB30|nr:NAD(P)H-dependent oxidoreductase [Novosphingobium sp. P6W]AXB75976.1 NADPH-dependent oxidoreductase [Novosphingobium sp. P6W]KIS31174.1 flavodoxin [Novosphingobium sp. P6W]